jgi:ribonuclease T2
METTDSEQHQARNEYPARHFVLRTLLATLVLLPPFPALAQAYQCRMPARVTVPPAPQLGQTVRMPIARYTLAASWSPDHCKMRGQNDPLQCSGKAGRFGFVLHGLWPEGAAGRWPQWCAVTPRPTPAQLAENLCMTPSPRLLEHAWAKHGSSLKRKNIDRSPMFWLMRCRISV